MNKSKCSLIDGIYHQGGELQVSMRIRFNDAFLVKCSKFIRIKLYACSWDFLTYEWFIIELWILKLYSSLIQFGPNTS